jgi:hypothetical protein
LQEAVVVPKSGGAIYGASSARGISDAMGRRASIALTCAIAA